MDGSSDEKEVKLDQHSSNLNWAAWSQTLPVSCQESSASSTKKKFNLVSRSKYKVYSEIKWTHTPDQKKQKKK